VLEAELFVRHIDYAGRHVRVMTGATGLVGYAALKHFGSQKDCEVIAVSRRQPDETFGARWHPLDLA